MALNTIDFKFNIAKFVKQIGVSIGEATEKISFDLHGNIIKRTPVDTGRARASFDVAIGKIPDGPPPPVVKNFKKGDTPLAAPTFNPDGEIDGTKSVFIVSNVDYIEYLENGSSKKAPAGMIRVAIAETAADLDSILLNNS